MLSTYLLAAFGCTSVVVMGFLGIAHRVAESRWNKHPLARVSHERAVSFASQF
ncbi:hypothetical protein [Herbaspirillum sp. YR522]|uniref:hypothetical protein n=1 Tax=Herbaspirillum sp. YR522 TaxID=1144342 RepID=UPI00026FC55B|nr:hypothetical protein [Herbaspirillum sp. YR522]EJM95603.1 hypothetical protein PMI40_04922 [Herbaspirillum sp. YR522]